MPHVPAPDLPAPAPRTLARAARPPAPAVASRTGARVLENVGAVVVRTASLVRGERVIHAKGTTVAARLVVRGGAGLGVPLLDEPGGREALVRFSRALGLPDRLPDVLGIAVRVLDAHGPGAHQDLLLAATVPLPFARRLPVPQYDLLGAFYTSVTPYELGGVRHLLAVVPDPDAPATRATRDVGGRGDGARLRLALSDGGRGWRDVAHLELGRPVPQGRQVRFSPDVTGGGIRPVGWLQDLRRRAYRASHVGPDA